MHQSTKHSSDIHDSAISDELVGMLVSEHRQVTRPALDRLWEYYRNELDFGAVDERRPYRASQEQGLPHRLTRGPGEAARLMEAGSGRREIVIENDIAWRLHTLVDFMFGKPVSIQSLAGDSEKAAAIEQVLTAALDAAGGIGFLQDMALLGGVYGYVDLLLRVDTAAGKGLGSATGDASARNAPSKPIDVERAARLASLFMIETVEAPRAIPVLDPSDYRQLVGYVVHYTQTLNEVDQGTMLSRLVDRNGRRRGRLATVDVTEVWTPSEVRVYHDNTLSERRVNLLGRLPVVHIQNLPQPFFYEGLSEVE
ncbi:MAG: hypothetical protein WD079_03910, partial [Phycisphaeraceae bacterium]